LALDKTFRIFSAAPEQVISAVLWFLLESRSPRFGSVLSEGAKIMYATLLVAMVTFSQDGAVIGRAIPAEFMTASRA